PLAVALDRVGDAGDVGGVEAEADNRGHAHQQICHENAKTRNETFVMHKPEPDEAFEWVQAAAGPALRCRPVAAVADHLFTTRPWRLGSSTSANRDDGWAEVGVSLGVDARGLARVHQVHGATVVVPRRGVDTAHCEA